MLDQEYEHEYEYEYEHEHEYEWEQALCDRELSGAERLRCLRRQLAARAGLHAF